MTTSIDTLLKRINALIAAIETRQEQQQHLGYGVVIYNPDTKEIIRGEPSRNGVTFWLPHNGRDQYGDDNTGPYVA